MLRRKAFDELMEWKNNPKHKSLLLKGQRQVGKTFILQEFAKTYDSHAYVDLSDDEKMASFSGPRSEWTTSSRLWKSDHPASI